jgi:hypothetical protein
MRFWLVPPRWRGMHSPTIFLSSMLNAANGVVVPWRR